ncbi:MAG: hypothetical protein ACXAAQ_16300 [Candidatus Thorarchaeota archaeon]|jgi:cellobiose-specific phosphotransferase system component IIA
MWYDFDERTSKLAQLQPISQFHTYKGDARYMMREAVDHLRKGRFEKSERVLMEALEDKFNYRFLDAYYE